MQNELSDCGWGVDVVVIFISVLLLPLMIDFYYQNHLYNKHFA
jgi:hypothetical protein